MAKPSNGVGLSFVQDDVDVTGPFSDRRGTSQRPGLESFHGRSLIHHDLFHIKTINIDGFFLGRIGDG